MKPEWFIKLLETWSVSKSLEATEVERACRLLQVASVSAGGRVVSLPDNPDTRGLANYASVCAKNSLDRYARLKCFNSSFSALIESNPNALFEHLEASIEFARERIPGRDFYARDTLYDEFLYWNMQEKSVRSLSNNLCEGQNLQILRDKDYVRKINSIIREAKDSLLVAVGIIMWDGTSNHPVTEVINSIQYALERNVQVDIYTSLQLGFGIQNRAGVRMRNTISYLQKKGASVVTNQTDRLFHAKVIIADNRIVVIGSHNWSGNSFTNFKELSIVCESKHLASIVSKRISLALV